MVSLNYARPWNECVFSVKKLSCRRRTRVTPREFCEVTRKSFDLHRFDTTRVRSHIQCKPAHAQLAAANIQRCVSAIEQYGWSSVDSDLTWIRLTYSSLIHGIIFSFPIVADQRQRTDWPILAHGKNNQIFDRLEPRHLFSLSGRVTIACLGTVTSVPRHVFGRR